MREPITAKKNSRTPDGYDLVYTIGEYNAPRPREEDCDNEADYYVFTDGQILKFHCEDHLPDAAREHLQR